MFCSNILIFLEFITQNLNTYCNSNPEMFKSWEFIVCILVVYKLIIFLVNLVKLIWCNVQEEKFIELYDAVLMNNGEKAVQIINYSPKFINRFKVPEGYTPFQVACANDNTQLVKYMIEKGANVNLKSKDGESPFYLATWYYLLHRTYKNSSTIRELFYANADIDAPGKNGMTVVQLAAMFGHASLLRCPAAAAAVEALGKTMSFQVLPTPVKSERDKKEYKVIRLDNGLTATLVSGKGAEESGSGNTTDQNNAAAGLCINVGSFSEPKEVGGLARLLLHMVLMGSKKYPDENTFLEFLTQNGGGYNAYADVKVTCFYFETLEKSLFKTLDIFAQFFISPLMKRNTMISEREVVEAEFQGAFKYDDARKEQLLANLADKNSPVNCFPWGSYITLKDNITDDDLYKKVQDFRLRHYSAQRMALAIESSSSIEELEKYVLEYFSEVPNNGLPGDDFSKFNESVFKTPEFTRMYVIKPVEDIIQVELNWALPSLKSKYKSKPQDYVSYLLGDEGEGSVLAYLKKKFWALQIFTGTSESGRDHNQMYAMFTVKIVLTKKGLENLNEIIAAVFSYINMLKITGPQKWMFDEMKIIADNSFKFGQEKDPGAFVEILINNMLQYPPKDFIRGSELYYEYDPKSIAMILEKLTPESMNIIVSSKEPLKDQPFDKKEKWFGTEYTDKEIPQNWIEQWKKVKPYSDLAVPEPNQFIAKDFSLVSETENQPKYPTKILDTPQVELWYRQDQKFKLPQAFYYIYVISPLSNKSAKNRGMLEALIELMSFVINEEIYPAFMAELNYEFIVIEQGFTIKVDGFNEKLPMLLNVITKYLKSLGDEINEEMFLIVKEKLLKKYYNSLLDPSELNTEVRLSLIASEQWTSAEIYSSLLNLNLNETQEFIKEYFKVLKLKTLVQGNVASDVVSKTIQEMVSNLEFKGLDKSDYPRFNVVQVPKGERCCRVRNFNTKDSNSIITNYYQSGPFTLKDFVILEIISNIIQFDIFETPEQFGYFMSLIILDTYGVLGYAVTVNAEATKNSTAYVEERIEAFLKHTQKLLADVGQDQFKKTKENRIETKAVVDVHLKDEVDRNWEEIILDEYIFDRPLQEIKLIEKTTLKEIRKWWDERNAFANKKKFRKLSIQVVGFNNTEIENNESPVPPGQKIVIECLTPNATAENKSENYFIANIDKFRTSLDTWKL